MNIRIKRPQIIGYGFCDFTNELLNGEEQVKATLEDQKILKSLNFITGLNEVEYIDNKVCIKE
jgi:hypothetical protein